MFSTLNFCEKWLLLCPYNLVLIKPTSISEATPSQVLPSISRYCQKLIAWLEGTRNPRAVKSVVRTQELIRTFSRAWWLVPDEVYLNDQMRDETINRSLYKVLLLAALAWSHFWFRSFLWLWGIYWTRKKNCHQISEDTNQTQLLRDPGSSKASHVKAFLGVIHFRKCCLKNGSLLRGSA